MPYAPPLVKPPLPPLRPPAPFPFCPPGPNRLPPTQTAPIFSPPTLLPPTDKDLKGIVCIYANTPIWEPKKIRYRYPGESWQEIAGDRYTIELLNIAGGNYVSKWKLDTTISSASLSVTPYGAPGCQTGTEGADVNHVNRPTDTSDMQFTGRLISVFYRMNNSPSTCYGGAISGLASVEVQYQDLKGVLQSYQWVTFNIPGSLFQFRLKSRSYKLRFIDITNDIVPDFDCVFKVFDVFNQTILSITRDVCPEVIVVPERCYFKAENERLVRRVIVGFLQNLKTEYNGNCATVWLDAPPLPFSTEIYKECSDNPSCPPPRIRFGKCEEKCEQCPPGTAIKVLLGGNIACVDSVGCVLKTVKYKPSCNSYDCICG